MKDGAIVANSGHFDVELDLVALRKMARRVRQDIRPNVDAYDLKDGRSILVLAGTTVVLFVVTIAVFDPERRFTARTRVGGVKVGAP